MNRKEAYNTNNKIKKKTNKQKAQELYNLGFS